MVNRTINFIQAITSAMMALLTIVVSYEVVSRYIFNYPVKQTGELVAIFFPWMIFLGAVLVTKDNGHFVISYFRNFLPKKAQVISLFITKLIMLYFSIYMILGSLQLAEISAAQQLPVLSIPKSWLHYSVTVSFIGITLVILYQLYLMIRKKEDTVPLEED